MDSNDYIQYKALCAALDKTKAALEAAHSSMIEHIESPASAHDKVGPLLRYCDAHDLAAEHWMDARRALLSFCRAHPDICAQDKERLAQA